MATLDQRIKALIARRELVYMKLTDLCDDFRQASLMSPQVASAKYRRLSNLENEYERVETAMIEINATIGDPKDKIPITKEAKSIVDLVDTVRAAYLKFEDKNKSNMAATVPHNSFNPVLPALRIPTFDGTIESWNDFITLYDSLVHDNTSLSNTQKFHYLRSNLKGEPLSTISSFAIDDANYTLAYDSLKDRYQNQRRLANYYLQQIIKFTTTASSSTNAQHFLDTHENAINALKQLHVQDLSDYILFQLSYNNLDVRLQKEFDLKQDPSDIPACSSLIDFVKLLAKTDELKKDVLPQTSNKLNKNCPGPTRKPNKPGTALLCSEKPFKKVSTVCPLCKSEHKLFQCQLFKTKTLSERYDVAKLHQLCFNCLGSHQRQECASLAKCKQCGSGSHHTLLHPDSAPAASSTSLSCHVTGTTVILGTLQAYVHDRYNKLQLVRVVVDTGSQVSVITADCAERLGCKLNRSTIDISGISDVATKSAGSVECVLCSRFNKHDKLPVSAVVLNKITNKLPTSSCSSQLYRQFKHLALADPHFHRSSSVDMLLGADTYCQLLSTDGNNIIPGQPSAIKTMFGWIIMGPCSVKSSSSSVTSLLALSPTLEQSIKSFWESEELPLQQVIKPEDKKVEQHFVDTTYRNKDGRYVVSLPFKPQTTPVESNIQTALASYHNLEKRLYKQPQLQKACHEFLQEYLELGHMEPAAQPARYVLPYHCVFKSSSSTTKVRVVFNASAPDASGISLNQRLSAGPKLQKDITHVITSFRLHQVPLCADIKMMYRQIHLNAEDRAYQHILWRPTTQDTVQQYQLNTVTYGLVPSAFQAQRVLVQLVQDEGDKFPLASTAVTNQTYVDDIVSGADSIQDALQLYNELTQLLRLGGFELRKWSSSSSTVLESIPAQHREQPLVFSSEDVGVKILGLMWDSKQDSFRYHVQTFSGPCTKRSILSYISRIFDPMGWLTPAVFWVKHFLQQLWLNQLDWDCQLPHSLQQNWFTFASKLEDISNIEIPRKIPSTYVRFSLAGFSDASERGYAAVVYAHCEYADGSCSSHLLKAKSKVAPLKVVTIPRLELNGAVLLSKLIESLSPQLTDSHTVYLFTDSSIVLSWINTAPHLLKTFVANRVCEVQKLTRCYKWYHVCSQDNPADVGSRGSPPDRLVNCSLWWYGPVFLTTPVHTWPAVDSSQVEPTTQELKTVTLKVTESVLEENDLYQLYTRYSSLTKLTRVVAYVLRFVNKLKGRTNPETSTLSLCEIQQAQLTLVRLSQYQYFSEDIKLIKQNQQPSQCVRKLSPFLDEDGLVRVGGRLRHAQLPHHTKHPLLLSRSCQLSKLICQHYHVKYLHAGARILQSVIQLKYWIMSIRSLLRSTIHLCIKCHKLRASPSQQLMGDLPPARVQISRPFTRVGVDYAGPFDVKENTLRKSRVTKGYLCLFVCTVVKAVHFEVVSDMTTEAFLAAFDRFTSRRGLPSDVYSDCGRNFVGAANQFKEISKFLNANQETFQSSLVSRNIRWHFNPPNAPNFGGLWEAAVKSAKTLLYRSIQQQTLTFEEYVTIFSRIEVILNSRPLTMSSVDPNDGVHYLSPGHFLVGSSLISPPEYQIDENVNLRCRWQKLKQLSQFFWRRWSSEYLLTLTQRNKWTKATRSIRVGELVYVCGMNTAPLSWPIGIIEAVHPGRDNLVRVVTVRTTAGTFLRPLNKIVVIPSSQ